MKKLIPLVFLTACIPTEPLHICAIKPREFFAPVTVITLSNPPKAEEQYRLVSWPDTVWCDKDGQRHR